MTTACCAAVKPARNAVLRQQGPRVNCQVALVVSPPRGLGEPQDRATCCNMNDCTMCSLPTRPDPDNPSGQLSNPKAPTPHTHALTQGLVAQQDRTQEGKRGRRDVAQTEFGRTPPVSAPSKHVYLSSNTPERCEERSSERAKRSLLDERPPLVPVSSQGLVEQQDEADNDGMMRSSRRAAGSSAGKAAAARAARLLHAAHPLEDVKEVARTYALCLQRLIQVGRAWLLQRAQGGAQTTMTHTHSSLRGVRGVRSARGVRGVGVCQPTVLAQYAVADGKPVAVNDTPFLTGEEL